MYKIETTSYGLKVCFSGNISREEINEWLIESEEKIKEKKSEPFHVLFDLRDVKDFSVDFISGFERGLRIYKQKSMNRCILVVENKSSIQKFNTHRSNIFLDSASHINWEIASIDYLLKGVDPTKKSRIKIREKLSILVGGTVFVVLIILGIFIYTFTQKNIKSMVEDKLKGTTYQIKDMIEISVKTSIEVHLRTIAEKNMELAKYFYNKSKKGDIKEAEAFQRYKEIILNKDSDYGKIGTTGYLLCSDITGLLVIHPKSEGQNLSNVEFMQRAIKLKNGYFEYDWKNVGETKERAKAAYVSYFEPWKILVWPSSYRDEFKSMIKIENFSKYISNIIIGKTGYVYILDNQGKVLAHKNPALIGKNLYDNVDKTGKYFIQEILKKKEGLVTYYWKSSDIELEKEKIVYVTYISEMDWYVAAGSYTDEFYSSLDIIRNVIIGSILVSFFILFFVITKSLSLILSPFQEVKEVVNGIANGDLTQKIEIRSKDEIGEISGYFNLIIDNFSELLHKFSDSIHSLSTSTQNLSVTSKEISATSNTQAAAIREIVSTMEDSDSLAKQISLSISEVNRISNQTKSNVETGVSFVQTSLDKMTEIKNKNKDTIIGIKALGDKIESIWDIVNIINGIVDQTKIIAFNAALEASSAGDAGKNFQIVASEIKRLADNTMLSTKEIKSKISEIQSSSNSLIIISEEGAERVKEGWDLSMKLEEVFNEILNSADITARSAGQIDLSIKQQVSSFEQILLTLKEISYGIENFVVSTKNTSQTSESLNDVAVELKKLIGKYTV